MCYEKDDFHDASEVTKKVEDAIDLAFVLHSGVRYLEVIVLENLLLSMWISVWIRKAHINYIGVHREEFKLFALSNLKVIVLCSDFARLKVNDVLLE